MASIHQYDKIIEIIFVKIYFLGGGGGLFPYKEGEWRCNQPPGGDEDALASVLSHSCWRYRWVYPWRMRSSSIHMPTISLVTFGWPERGNIFRCHQRRRFSFPRSVWTSPCGASCLPVGLHCLHRGRTPCSPFHVTCWWTLLWCLCDLCGRRQRPQLRLLSLWLTVSLVLRLCSPDQTGCYWLTLFEGSICAPGTLVCIYCFRVRPSLFIFRFLNSSSAGSSCLFLRFSVQSFYKQPSHLGAFSWLSVRTELIKKWRHFGSAAAARLPLVCFRSLVFCVTWRAAQNVTWLAECQTSTSQSSTLEPQRQGATHREARAARHSREGKDAGVSPSLQTLQSSTPY